MARASRRDGLRILVISNLLPPRVLGGYEIACYNLVRGLLARGHDVRVITTDTSRPLTEPQPFVERSLVLRNNLEPAPREPGIQALVDHESRVSLLHNTLAVLEALRAFRPDHVIAFNLLGIGGLAIAELLGRASAPWTFNLGDRVPSLLVAGARTAEIRALYRADAGEVFRSGQTAAISQAIVDEVRGDGIGLGEPVEVIPRGVLAHGVVRGRPHLDGGVARFIAAGTLGEHKGTDLVLEASRLLNADGYAGRFTVDVYGAGAVEDYRARATAAGVGASVQFLGPVSQHHLVEREADADAFLFPTSEREPFGSAPFEAASVGCVPIVTGASGAAERLADGVTALKIRRDAASLRDAMRRVIDGDVDLDAMSAAGTRLTQGDLGFDRSLDRLERMVVGRLDPGWDARVLDSAELASETAEKDAAALRSLYDYLDGGGLAEVAREMGYRNSGARNIRRRS